MFTIYGKLLKDLSTGCTFVMGITWIRVQNATYNNKNILTHPPRTRNVPARMCNRKSNKLTHTHIPANNPTPVSQ